MSATQRAIAYPHFEHYRLSSMTEKHDTCYAWIARLPSASHGHSTTTA